MTTRLDERRQLEMDRGRAIAGRAKRNSDLRRYIKGKKVKLVARATGHPEYAGYNRINEFWVADVKIAEQAEHEDDYPSEGVMAVIALSVAATEGTDGIPSSETIDPAERRRRDEYRRQMGRNLARSEGNA
jgi:hypothetical protein